MTDLTQETNIDQGAKNVREVRADAVKVGDTVVFFGNGWTVRKATAAAGKINLIFAGVTGKQVCNPETMLQVRG